jgi:hypothetical protein
MSGDGDHVRAALSSRMANSSVGGQYQPVPWIGLGKPSVLDAELLTKQLVLLLELVCSQTPVERVRWTSRAEAARDNGREPFCSGRVQGILGYNHGDVAHGGHGQAGRPETPA